MKRLRVELIELADRTNLTLALYKSARGRWQQPAVRRWLAAPDAHLDALALAILRGQAPSHQTREFSIRDPKRRTISAPCFADRVLHHAVMNVAEPRLEGSLVPSTYACRPGLGVHASVCAVQGALRRWPWFVQVDVASYFASICHRRLMELLRRRFKGEEFLALLERIVRGAPNGRDARRAQGLPIGALTSQHFANAYLDAADRWLLQHPAVCGHARYMDDMVWWCGDAEQAQHVLDVFSPWLQGERALVLKPGARPQPSAHGIRWCGFEITRATVRPGPRKRQRFAEGVSRLRAADQAGWATDEQLQRAHDALLATLAHTDSLALRRRLWRQAAEGQAGA